MLINNPFSAIMKKKYPKILNYIVPIIALIVIAIQVVMVETNNLSKWRGGGFGMYSEAHYQQREVWINNTNIELDSIFKKDEQVELAVKRAKLLPGNSELRKTAKLVKHLFNADTLTIQVWKPYTDISTSKYSRKLVNEVTYIK